ncbi:hypothetical protein STH12_04250 (plasmid) [Shewanella khirikhana]|uniref:Uncharacterized protein n=1 Tax=Shewanella khirikhana TaxID=1965282 RepID=A0ABN5U1W5_9GAMM|nr:hypothetical protein STH12_04250 [Shewanella khirikhana]
MPLSWFNIWHIGGLFYASPAGETMPPNAVHEMQIRAEDAQAALAHFQSWCATGPTLT